jgi:energy-coupling factor transport system permease protein
MVIDSMHPSLRILALILLAVFIQFAGAFVLGIVGLVLLIPVLLLYRQLLRQMLKRSRWLFATMLLIFAFTTPGEYPVWWDWGIAPTYEGLRLGLLQSTRLAIMLAGLALLMGSTPRASMMAGIFPLLSPLRHVGISPERFTARLWLTLHYVEEAPLQLGKMRWSTLGQAEPEGAPVTAGRVQLMVPAFSSADWGIVLGTILLALWWLG